jgi:hypothetical protein
MQIQNEYLRAFVIGSCFFVIFPYFYVVSNFNPSKSNINYSLYTYYAPLWLGLFNVLSLFIAKQFKLSKRMRFITIGILAPSSIAIFLIIIGKVYNYTTAQWIRHIFILYLFYLFMFNCVVYLLDKYV